MGADLDVLVVGAGPVGMTLTGELLRHGVSCRVIDCNEGPATLSKAIAVHSRSLAMFDDMGLADRLVARGVPVHTARIHVDGKPIPPVPLDAAGPPYPFMLCIAQNETESLLDQHVRELGGEVERRVELVGFEECEGGVAATLRHGDGTTEQVNARWVAGCDGAHSFVREHTGTGFEGVTYPELYWLGDTKVSWDRPADELAAWMTDEGTIAFFPLPGRFRLIGQPNIPSDAERKPPTLAEFEAFARDRTGIELELSDPGWLATFAVNRRLVTTMRPHSSIFLLGDAAHIHSPAGGQGMNTGMQDAYNLAWKLALVADGAAPQSLLETFESERRPVIASMERNTDLMSKASLAKGIRASIRNRFAPLLLGIDAIREYAAREMSELKISYKDSPLVEHEPHRRHPTGGELVVDAGELRDASGAPTRWLDVIAGTDYVAVVFAGDRVGSEAARHAAEAASALERAYQGRLQTRVVVLGEETPSGDVRSAVLDPTGDAHQRLGFEHGGIVIVRPDQYLAAVHAGFDTDASAAVLGSALDG